MYAFTTFATILAIATSTFANPISVKLDSRDAGTFRLISTHWHQTQCIPGACGGGNTIDQMYVGVDDGCNGGGCNGKRTTITWDESYCDVEVKVCDRTFKLVSRGPDDCKRLGDLGPDNNGQAYATIVEGDKDVGTCSVDFSQHSAASCGALGGGFEFQSHVYCAYS